MNATRLEAVTKDKQPTLIVSDAGLSQRSTTRHAPCTRSVQALQKGKTERLIIHGDCGLAATA